MQALHVQSVRALAIMYRYILSAKQREAILVGVDCTGPYSAAYWLPYLGALLFCLQMTFDDESIWQLTNTNLALLVCLALWGLYLFWSGAAGVISHLYYFSLGGRELLHINSGQAIDLESVKKEYSRKLGEGDTRRGVDHLHVKDVSRMLSRLNWGGLRAMPGLPARRGLALPSLRKGALIGVAVLAALVFAILGLVAVGGRAFLPTCAAFAVALGLSASASWWLERCRAPRAAAAVEAWAKANDREPPVHADLGKRRWSQRPRKRGGSGKRR